MDLVYHKNMWIFYKGKIASTSYVQDCSFPFEFLYRAPGFLFRRSAISKTRNTGTTEHRNTEHRNSIIPEHGTPEFVGTLKILNLLKIREKNTGGCESIAAIIIA
jgi:hypothetical protein